MEKRGCEIHARAPAGAKVLMFMQTSYKREKKGMRKRDMKGRGESTQSSRMCVCINVFMCVCASRGMGGIP